jgi:uncharacterized peroxidase-related enzyme
MTGVRVASALALDTPFPQATIMEPMTKKHIFLADVESHPQPGAYAELIRAANSNGAEYWGIWNLLAFRPKIAYHLCELSHQLMFEEAPLSPVLRELIAAYTSQLNRCNFCMHAHAAVAAELYQDEDLVWSILRDLESSGLDEKDKALMRFVRKLTLDPASIGESDIRLLQSSGWDDASIYYAIGACALFNFYNRFVSGNGVRMVSHEAFRSLSEHMAKSGYRRETPRAAAEKNGK